MSIIKKIDTISAILAKRYFELIARISLFVIFFYFGFLKIIGLSPANDLAIGFAERMGAGAVAVELYYILAFVECLIGILILFPKLTKLAVTILLAHMVLVSAPIILYPEAVWESFLVPNLEGQYIIKNLALVAVAVGLIANTGTALSRASSKKRR